MNGYFKKVYAEVYTYLFNKHGSKPSVSDVLSYLSLEKEFISE